MLKFASRKVCSPTKMLFPKPENLLELEQQFKACDSPEEIDLIAKKFTQTVAALRIGHICKMTRWGRLDKSLSILADLVDPSDAHRLLDIGVSDGITTLEAVRFLLEQRNCKVSAIGVDLHSELVRYQRCCLSEYRSGNGEPVLAQFGPFMMTIGAGASPGQPISRFIAANYMRLRRMRSRLNEKTRISLVNPLARQSPQTSFEVQNIFERRNEWTNSFTIVRAANVLNRQYFSDSEILRALDNLFCYLHDGGILLISRNLAPRESPHGEENGSFWSKTIKGFEFISDVGRGSCVADLVNRFRPSSPIQTIAQ